MTTNDHAKDAMKKKKKTVKEDEAPVEKLSLVTPKNPKTKKRKTVKEPSPVESIQGSEPDVETETLAVKDHSSVKNNNLSEEETSKLIVEEEEEEEKKSVTRGQFQKQWKDEEELAVLEGILNFKNVNRKSYADEKEEFYSLIEDKISEEFRSLRQVFSKISYLKSKYMSVRKTNFTSEHDVKCLAIAKSIWGNDVVVKKKKKKKVDEDTEKDVLENSFMSRAMSSSCLGADKQKSMMKRWSLVDVKRRKVTEDGLKELEDEEFHISMRRGKFLYDAMVDAYKASTSRS